MKVEKATQDVQAIAEAIDSLAKAVGGLLYGLKYSQSEGMSISESLEVGLKDIAQSIRHVGDGLSEVASAVEGFTSIQVDLSTKALP